MLSLPATGSAAFHATAHGGRGTDRRLGHATQRSAARSERLGTAHPARRRSQRPGSVDSPDRRRFALDRVVVDHGRTPAHKGATKRSEMVSSSNCRVIISSRRRGCTYRSNSRAQGKRRARLTCWQIRVYTDSAVSHVWLCIHCRLQRTGYTSAQPQVLLLVCPETPDKGFTPLFTPH